MVKRFYLDSLGLSMVFFLSIKTSTAADPEAAPSRRGSRMSTSTSALPPSFSVSETALETQAREMMRGLTTKVLARNNCKPADIPSLTPQLEALSRMYRELINEFRQQKRTECRRDPTDQEQLAHLKDIETALTAKIQVGEFDRKTQN